MKPVNVVHVGLKFGKETFKVGRLALKDRQIFFEYDPDFLKRGLEISPLKLPLKTGVQACEDLTFEGLWGVFNDSLPDGWGRLLWDRKLRQLGAQPEALSPLDRLRYVGQNGMGALTYDPEYQGPKEPEHPDLDTLADEAAAVLEHDADSPVDDLLSLNGSSAGARPKVLLRQDGRDWMVKFRASMDPQDAGPVELAYHAMAQTAGLEVPAARLFASRKGPGFFGVERFDRGPESQRTHMHTMSGLIHADHRLPNLDYEAILRATAWLTRDVRQIEKQFRAAVFNILSHNRDDHAKNFSFLMDVRGTWTVSPAYDLTFSCGPSGEHCTMLMGEGKRPRKEHFMQLAKIVSLKESRAQEIIDAVQASVKNWPKCASEAGVSQSSKQHIQSALKQVWKNFNGFVS